LRENGHDILGKELLDVLAFKLLLRLDVVLVEESPEGGELAVEEPGVVEHDGHFKPVQHFLELVQDRGSPQE